MYCLLFGAERPVFHFNIPRCYERLMEPVDRFIMVEMMQLLAVYRYDDCVTQWGGLGGGHYLHS